MLLLIMFQKGLQQRRQMCSEIRTSEIHIDVFDSSASINHLFLLIRFQCQWTCLSKEGFPKAHMFVDSSFKIIRPVTRKSVSSLGDERLDSCLRVFISHIRYSHISHIEKWLKGTVESFAFVAAGTCSPSHCLATAVSSGFTI
jgi:hypothetical protein